MAKRKRKKRRRLTRQDILKREEEKRITRNEKILARLERKRTTGLKNRSNRKPGKLPRVRRTYNPQKRSTGQEEGFSRLYGENSAWN